MSIVITTEFLGIVNIALLFNIGVNGVLDQQERADLLKNPPPHYLVSRYTWIIQFPHDSDLLQIQQRFLDIGRIHCIVGINDSTRNRFITGNEQIRVFLKTF